MGRYYSLQKNAWPWLWVSLVVLLLDQGTKALAEYYLTFGGSTKVFSLLNFTLTYNRGAAFGFLNVSSLRPGPLLTSLSSIVITLLILWLWQLSRTAYLKALSISLIIGGAAGNLVDRLFRSHVVDFIDFHYRQWHYPVFNLADTVICIGVILLAIVIWRAKEI
jgi:signal peptidase II